MPITYAIKSFLVLLALLPVAQLQIFNNSSICATETLVTKTVFDFWHENIQSCEININNLLIIRKKILINTAKQNNDKIINLLQSHVSSSVMETLFNQLIATVSTKSLTTKPALENVINQLYEEFDKSFVLKIWQKVLDELLLFVSEEEILQQLFLLTNDDLKLNLLEYFFKKYEKQFEHKPKILSLLTFGVTSVLKKREQTQVAIGDPTIGRLLAKLPEQLLTIFQSWHYNVSILNSHYNEYIFSERHKGPAATKRFLLSFLPTKNTFRVKGKFKVQYNSQGLLTFGAPFNGTYKYLTAETNSAFICLDCALSASQWWQVLWPYAVSRPIEQQLVLFQNVATQELLCATSVHDENFVLISTLDLAQHMNNSQCLWKVVKRNK